MRERERGASSWWLGLSRVSERVRMGVRESVRVCGVVINSNVCLGRGVRYQRVKMIMVLKLRLVW